MPCVLQPLPAEILISILELLSPPDLAQLCRTSKPLLHYARPFLYTEITIDSNFPPPPSFYQLVRSIVLVNPSLGLYVKHLNLHIHSMDERRPAAKKEPTPPDLLGIPSMVERLSTIPQFKPLDLWEEGLWTNQRAALATILLFHTSNIHGIRIHESYMETTEYLESLLQHDSLKLPYLSSLEILPLRLYDTHYYTTQRSPLSYFLNRHTLHTAGGVITHRDIDSLPPSTKITHLHCHFLHPSGLRHLLEVTPDLQDLEYRPWGDKPRHGFNCTELHQALSQIAKTVKRIVVQPGKMYSDALSGEFGPLRKFSRLEELELPWVILTTINGELGEVLPRSLRRLETNDLVSECITGPRQARRERLFNCFLSEWWEYTPYLRAVIGEESYELSESAERGRQRLCDP
ncbi:hypothetical protein BJY04DRAFT_224323 [Aspergillus karnatakaensis]|uniref:F-box protein n=1 Tax=Aspergillus karnatakaensis TaxID=1810916 RepID=UPI003CCE0D09